MSVKAILVIDMPERCVECPLCDGEGYPLCTAIHKNIGSLAYYFGGDKERNPYCPLKPLPKKLNSNSDCDEIDEYFEEKHGFTRHGCIYDVVNTWNACLDEITGETE